MTPLAPYRTPLFVGLIGMLVAIVFAAQGAAYGLRMLAEAACYAVIALGLTIQWGYAGLFNAGIMGFIAIGAFVTMLFTYPVNQEFWASGGPEALGAVLLRLLVGIGLFIALRRLCRAERLRRWRTFGGLAILAGTYIAFMSALEPAAALIESGPGFIGGFGFPVLVGWIAGGLAAGGIAYFIGRICLGLRSDYLAIATLGIAEIIKALLKNADWLTRGTLTVSPLDWPVPTPGDIGFELARAAYLCLVAVMIVAIYMLVTRAYNAPWGRMMRAIRDNELSAAAMGKDVNRRRLEIFVLGCILIGIGGSALISFSRIFDPSGFLPLNHTFLIWVMVILGGAGNNLGAVLGALLVYIIWTMSEPAALAIFGLVRDYGEAWFGWQAPEDLDSRALQMRVFVIGLTITLVLRFAPRGILPEQIKRHD